MFSTVRKLTALGHSSFGLCAFNRTFQQDFGGAGHSDQTINIKIFVEIEAEKIGRIVKPHGMLQKIIHALHSPMDGYTGK